MRWTADGGYRWRFAIFPFSFDTGKGYEQWVWLEWYQVNIIGKVRLIEDVK